MDIEDLAYLYHERAAILEFEGKHKRKDAERMAIKQLIVDHQLTKKQVFAVVTHTLET